ncbi:MAG: YbjN domain-containing protein, partial [Parachlamydiaceae bacterium]
MLTLDANEIVDFLKTKSLPALLQKETNQAYYIHKTSEGEFPVFFRIFDKQASLQILTFFPMQITKERYNMLARLLNQINNDIDMPGFGMDEKMNVVFHRLMVPSVNGKIDTSIIENYLKGISQLCTHFGKVIKRAVQS